MPKTLIKLNQKPRVMLTFHNDLLGLKHILPANSRYQSLMDSLLEIIERGSFHVSEINLDVDTISHFGTNKFVSKINFTPRTGKSYTSQEDGDDFLAVIAENIHSAVRYLREYKDKKLAY